MDSTLCSHEPEKRALSALAQKPLPSAVWVQRQLVLPLQANLGMSAPQFKAQWQLPFSKGVLPFLRHLR